MENNQPQLRIAQRPSGVMSLSKVTTGKRREPYRLVLAGVEGIGKTTFIAHAPKPILLEPEQGSGHLDVPRFPAPVNLADVYSAIDQLTIEQHDYQTLGLDTLDWVEPLIWQFVCMRDGKLDIEDYGYGKGYQVALDEWRKILTALERLQAAKGMNIILNAHTALRTFKNPEGEDFDRYELKLNLKAAGLVKEWAKAVLFTNYETFAVKAKGALKAKGVASGARLLYSTRSAAYDAKNRYSLPAVLPLSWAEFDRAARLGQPLTPEEFTEAIKLHAGRAGGDVEKQALGALERTAGDAGKLAELLNWVAAKLAVAAQSNPAAPQSKES